MARRKAESATAPPPFPRPRAGEGKKKRAAGEKLVCLGRIVAAHGVQGWVGVETYTEAAGDLVAYGEFADEAGAATFAIDEARMGPKGLLVRFAGVSDRNAAEALKGTRLCVPRASLPKIREKESYYHADLIGLAAARTDGAVLGRVVAVQNFGAGDLLEIAQPGNPNTLLVPFTQAIVPEVDVKAGRVVIDPPPGLLDSPATGGARTEHGPGEQDGADE